jgi:hypothetical protein
LSVTNADGSGKAVDRDGELDAVLQDFASEGCGDLHAAGASIVSAVPIGHVGPTLEEDTLAATFRDNVQAAFQSNKVSPSIRIGLRQTRQGLGSLARSKHQFFSICGCVPDAARDVDTDYLEFPSWDEHRAKTLKRSTNGRDLRAPGTTHGNL